MDSPVKIKSSHHGLRIVMNQASSMESIEADFRQKLTDGRKFFGNAKMAISFEGKKLTEEEEDHFCDMIAQCTDITVVCVVDASKMDTFFEETVRTISEEFKRNDVKFIKGSVTDQDFIDSDKDIIVIGDVHPGCTLISAGSIFVFGSLYGEAYAGIHEEGTSDGKSEGFILAMEMAPEELRIGGLFYQPAKKSRWGTKTKLFPQIAYASNDKINIEPYTKELLKRMTDS